MVSNSDALTPIVLAHPSAPALALHVLPYGLTLHRLLVRTPLPSSSPSSSLPSSSAASGSEGELHDLLVGPEDAADHRDAGRSFMGPIVGRYANRLPAGKRAFGSGGTVGEVDLPEWGGEGICHHGGPESTAGGQSGPFDRAVWTLLPSSSSKFFSQGTAEGSSSSSGAAGSSGGDGVSANTASNAPEVAPAGSEAIFALESPAGDQGFPGALRVEARISVQPPSPSPSSGNAGSLGAISLVYRAMLLPTDPPCAGTPLNLTHHWGFNLSASSSASAAARAEEGLVDEHVLTLTPPQGESLRLLALDSQGIPTGELRAVNEGTAGPHDWVGAGRGKRIGAAMPECGYDHFYILGPAASEEEAKNVRAELESASTGLAVRFRTNQTGVQLYTANGQPVSGLPSSAAGGSRKHLHVHPRPSKDAKDVPGNATRSAAFLEFGHPHATFLNPETLGKAAGTDTILRPGEVYENWVTADVCWRERIGAQ